jgi:hypothetical protein
MKQQKNTNILILSLGGKKFQVDFEDYKLKSAESLQIKFAQNRRKVPPGQRLVVQNYLKAEGFIR